MARVEYSDPIEALHGKIAKGYRTIYKKMQSKNASGTFRKFTSVCSKRVRPYDAGEIAAHTRFGAISAACTARLKDPTKMTTDRSGFANQSEYATLKQYVWHQCADEYDAAE